MIYFNPTRNLILYGLKNMPSLVLHKEIVAMIIIIIIMVAIVNTMMMAPERKIDGSNKSKDTFHTTSTYQWRTKTTMKILAYKNKRTRGNKYPIIL